MIRFFSFILILVLFIKPLSAQQSKIYNPSSNALNEINDALKKASAEKKFVLIQAGGNWCKWCLEFDRFSKADVQIDSLIKNNFVLYHLNYSNENLNKEIFEKYGYPQRFGFPVFLILNGKGERIHTQNSSYLENGKNSYDQQKVFNFLDQWKPDALLSQTYAQ